MLQPTIWMDRLPMYLSQRMQSVQRPIIPIVAELIRQHPGTISLGQGVVHYGPPPQALERVGQFAADPENHKYKSVEGIAPLVEALQRKLAAENNMDLQGHSRVVVTAGGNMAFFNALLAVADPDDEIILLAPYYFNHEMAVAMLNCRAVVVPCDAEYQIDLDRLCAAVTPRTRAIVTVSPNNPTGAVYPRGMLAEVNALCRDRRIYHIHDEAYEYFVYEGAGRFSPGSLPGAAEHTISLYSFSKAYGFASWRIGYMVIPEPLSVAVRKAQDTILICPPVISQQAALGALSAGPEYTQANIKRVAAVRRMVLEELEAVRGFCTIPPALGAFYFLLRVDTPLDSMAVVERLVREFGVAVIPGTTFGIESGCYLRVAYGALDSITIVEGVGRLVRGLKAIVGAAGS
ncbi:MAG TPA: pyridoxal phosphate-dependent aminotransferase [Pirellulales bacterium]|nr:pyridoxal phosphate-dependent aminotransferase [Pirellulales bacterium]